MLNWCGRGERKLSLLVGTNDLSLVGTNIQSIVSNVIKLIEASQEVRFSIEGGND